MMYSTFLETKILLTTAGTAKDELKHNHKFRFVIITLLDEIKIITDEYQKISVSIENSGNNYNLHIKYL